MVTDVHKMRSLLTANRRLLRFALAIGLSIALYIVISYATLSERQNGVANAQLTQENLPPGCSLRAPNFIACPPGEPPSSPAGCYYEARGCTGPRVGAVCFYALKCNQNPQNTPPSAPTPTPGISCQNTYPSNSTPPTSFGASWNVLSGGQELLIKSTGCTSTNATLTVGNSTPYLYTYNRGYFYNGSSWQLFNLSGTLAPGSTDWIIGPATGTIPRLQTPTYFVGYTCQLINSSWKCGCSDSACNSQ